MSRRSFEIDMTSGSIMDKLISFSLPLMLSGILQLLFNAVDIIIVGRFTGSTALAAVGSTTALINMMINLFIGISIGTNVLAARFYAAQMREELQETVHTSVAFSIISGIFMGVLGVVLARPALLLMDTPADVIDQSVLYMRIYFCGMPFFMIYNYCAAILRAVGDTKRPLLFLFVSGCLNAVLNYILVRYFDMGVAGVAIATVVSQLLSCILVVICLLRESGDFHLDFKKLSIRWRYLKEIFKVGIPAGLQSTVINFSNALLQSSVNSFGANAMAGYTAANNVLGFLYVSVNSITQACMSFMSQNLGALKKDRLDKVFRDCVILELVLPLILGGLAFFFARDILGIYTRNSVDVEYGFAILSITTFTYFLCGIMDLIPGAMRGLGHSTVPMILSIIGTVGTRIVWIFGLFPTHHTPRFLFVSYPVSWIITILMQVVCFYFVRRKVMSRIGADFSEYKG